MTARMRRLASDFEQIKKEFSGHPYIRVNPNNTELPDQYHVTYFVNGIYLLPDGKVEVLGRHEVDITLHAKYPRYKPICKISTPIWHPNFRDGQICIGDIWGAGESLSDIILNIGDMIQYKSWNSYSPLSADAAEWAIKNKHIFPVGTLELRRADYSDSRKEIEISLFDENEETSETQSEMAEESSLVLEPAMVLEKSADTISNLQQSELSGSSPVMLKKDPKENDFVITANDLAGIEFVPTAARMQNLQHGGLATGRKINIKTILLKGLLWGLIGGLIGFVLQEFVDISADMVLKWMINTDNPMTFGQESARALMALSLNISSAFFSAFIALGLGAFLGLGEGIYYGSAAKAFKYFGIGAGISLAFGFVSGFVAQSMYSAMLSDSSSDLASALIRGIGWSVMGLGVGLAIGLIKPEGKRVLFCGLGGLAGGFIGGFLFNFISSAISLGENDTGIIPRAVGIIIMGLLVGLGIGLLEQFAKSAWLKVVRGEFEGKEYLVFTGTTSIGNNGKNTIVLFKDKLVGPHHCDIILEGNKYVLIDKGTPMGTVVNGQRIMRHVLRKGDTIAIGNSVLVFQTK